MIIYSHHRHPRKNLTYIQMITDYIISTQINLTMGWQIESNPTSLSIFEIICSIFQYKSVQAHRDKKTKITRTRWDDPQKQAFFLCQFAQKLQQRWFNFNSQSPWPKGYEAWMKSQQHSKESSSRSGTPEMKQCLWICPSFVDYESSSKSCRFLDPISLKTPIWTRNYGLGKKNG